MRLRPEAASAAPPADPAPRPAADPAPPAADASPAPGSADAPPAPAADAARPGAVGDPAPAAGSGDASAADAPAADAAEGAGDASRGTRRSRFAALVRRMWRSSAVAAASGLALAAAFPPYDVWPLSLAAVAAFALLMRGRTVRQGAWLGFAFGLPFFIWLLQWLHTVGWDAVVGLSIAEACFLALLGAFTVPAMRLPGWPVWVSCLWVTEELARDRLPFGGFPWGRLAFANTGSPFTPLAALGGAPLVTFAVALSGALLAAAALALVRLRPQPRSARTALSAAGALAVSAAVLLAGLLVPVPTDAAGHVRIAVVQGNVQQPGMHFLGRPMMILDNHVKATLKLAADIKAGKVPKPDLVLWPENSSDLDPFSHPAAYDKITEAVQAVGVPVLVGVLVDGPDEDHVQNEGIVWDPVKGPGAHYTKQHPVPFGEYVPFREELTKVISRLDEIPRDFYPGTTTGVLQVGPARLGDVICFEVAYDGIVRDTVNAGARALVVQTNNATYGETGQPEQQLAMSRLRAIEHGRAVVTAATSGISAIVAPDGKIEQRSREFTRTVLNADIPLRDGTTLADRVGAAPEWTLAMVGLLSCAAAVALGRRERTRTAKGQEQQ